MSKQPRATVGRAPKRVAAEEVEAPTPQEVTDMHMRTVTTAIRRDLWRELGKLKADDDRSIQDLMNKAVFHYLTSRGYTITVPLED